MTALNKLQLKNWSVYSCNRIATSENSTLGLLDLDGTPFGFSIEDLPQKEKTPGKTRIEGGNTLELKIKRELTPLTEKYRDKYSWFKYHIEINGIRHFDNVYVHIGNFHWDSNGCPVIGAKASFDKNGDFQNTDSYILFKEWYLKTYEALELGKRIFWRVVDETDR